jgi:endonuclease-8
VPEGDTVWLTARRLHDALCGEVLTRADFRVPKLATADLAGRSVREVVARGKHILMRVEGGLTFHSHLRMDGSWRLVRGARLPGNGPPHQIRVILRSTRHTAVGYRLHDLAVVATDDEQALVGHLGPDTLGPDWDEADAVRRLLQQPGREIGDALLDQRNLAGIGNLYKAETLFLSGISPWALVGAVPDLVGVVRRAQRLLRANRDRWEQVTTGVNRRGEQLWVFERRGEPCRRCGTPIRMDMQGQPPYDRMTYWCPACQPGIGAGEP